MGKGTKQIRFGKVQKVIDELKLAQAVATSPGEQIIFKVIIEKLEELGK
jgi:hypothetical protein